MARTKEVIEAELDELRAALTRRLTGKMVTGVSDEGSSVSYSPFAIGSIADLRMQIKHLENELAQLTGQNIRRCSRPVF